MIYRGSGSDFVQNLAFSMSEAALFPSKLTSHFYLNFFITFYVGFGSKSGSLTGTLSLSGSGSAKATSYGSCVSSSTTLCISGFY
jgi:hypothetical protein